MKLAACAAQETGESPSAYPLTEIRIAFRVTAPLQFSFKNKENVVNSGGALGGVKL